GNPTVIKWQESDDTVATNFADISPGLVGGTQLGTSVGFVIPSQAVLGFGSIVQFQIDLRNRKRYLQCICQPGTSATVNLSLNGQRARAEQLPVTAAQKSIKNFGATNSTSVAAVVVQN